MNQHDPLSKSTVELLRAPLPDSAPRPGFETRLLSQVHGTAPSPSFSLRFALAGLCSAVLIAMLVVLNVRDTSPPPVTETATTPSQPVLELTKLPNPLGLEAEAIRSSATRASQFLLSCLPSLPDPGQSL